MTTLTTLRGGAGLGQRAARGLEGPSAAPLEVYDAAVIDWPLSDSRPVAWQITTLHHQLGLTGAFWGLLFAHLFLLPLSVADDGPGVDGQTDRSLRTIGFDGQVLSDIRAAIGPGCSALFVLHADTSTDRMPLALPALAPALAAIRLTSDESRRLYTGFADRSVRHP